MIKDLKVGDRVKVTQASLQHAINGNKGIEAYPSDTFIELFSQRVGQEAEVFYRHKPGYDVTIQFADKSCFHCKEQYVESV